ncbi:MAG: acyl-CoA thioesterase [Sediminibacterium sp.]|nr:acyl-CoA thioesterase [Sediminibacterium sp.]
MERVKINLPTNFSFCYSTTIRLSDLNYGNHVGNDKYLTLLQEARMAFLQSKLYTELNIDGVGIVVADAAIEYKKELFYNDEIKIYVQAANFISIGFDLFYKVEVIKNDLPIIVAKAKTGIVTFDYINRKKKSLSQQAINKLSEM